jgi:Tfp pilus assembly protein PilO
MSSSELAGQWARVARRSAALLLLVFLVLAGWYILIDPVRTVALSQGQWRTAISAELARTRSILATETQLKAYRETLERALVLQKFYRQAGTDTPDMQLRRTITDAATNSGASVQSVEPVSAVSVGALRRYGVRFAGSMKIDQLQKLLTSLRQSAAYLRVGRLSISAPQVQKIEENPTLSVRMDLYGYGIASAMAVKR